MSDCVFCIDNWPNLDLVEQQSWSAVIRPLNPVTNGHVLVIHSLHTEHAADGPSDIAADLMRLAADYVARHRLQANIITSIGPNATQTVRHTHLHIVPRREGDGLTLPWTGQQQLDGDR